MRVIAGTARGVRLANVPEGVRPTADRVRESVFNSLGQFFDGGAVLDLYAGTGALGIEALSRGCERAMFVEKDRRTAEVIRKNLDAVRFSGVSEVVVGKSAVEARRVSGCGMGFDLIFCDPPYRIARHEMGELLPTLNEILTDDGTLVLEAEESLEDLALTFGFTAKSRRYGQTFVTTARKAGS